MKERNYKFIELCENRKIKPYTVIRELKLPTSIGARWKSGSTPSVYTIYDIAKYLECRIEDLIEKERL